MQNENNVSGELSRIELAEKQLAELEAEFARREAALKDRLEARRAELWAKIDLNEKDPCLTAGPDWARERLGKERREFKDHYAALEKDFEAREKELLDEIRTLKEKDTKRSLAHELLGVDLATALERKQAAESKASSAAIELMEMNVYNKSAALALKERDMEISDLKQALEEARAGAARSAARK